MSFAEQINNLSESKTPMCEVSQSTTMAPDGRFITGTPAGVAVGSALVAAAWTGAQVGDVAD